MADQYGEVRAKLEIIRKWTNQELVNELRNPMRALCSQDVYVPLLVEAVARILERKKRGLGKLQADGKPLPTTIKRRR